ncbi:MAG: hypothetical protein EZS28_029437 [Streblomastix strix]|uniref:Tc1-like transposase DDE domain-containing protein n=1 Tax=Streblomastix strix TaxID=222440 RepID=A0A5J4UX50_9EUKA|nr:MAG: hypothetical protein EZS28_029437 [Streblomastix strix]
MIYRDLVVLKLLQTMKMLRRSKRYLKKSPTSPIREVSAKAALSLSSTERIKLRLGLKSYRMQRRHALLSTDLPTRKAAFEALLFQQQNNKQFKRRLIFTDECSFQLGGTVNTYNCYYHSLENPHYTADIYAKYGTLDRFWLQQDGAPAHTAEKTKDLLRDRFVE